ncbi:hypothetical protein VitviT2T_002061 [Vitis vinifera]|uniref:Uncharacterized protein n=1 Tax=Vitis vinifera TaxID=29760 RepID=A0ABY9BHM1_VITVI|nr:hypothetical protein VitviT2T_002061 [Vitis vinifera]
MIKSMAQTALTEGVSVLPSILPLPPLIFLILKHLKAKSPSLPPGPYPWPLIGNVHQIGKQRHIAMIDFARSYVPLFSLRLGTQTLVVGSSAAAAREILNSYDHILCARCVPRVIPCRITGLNGFAVGWSPECDDRWKYLRTMCRTQLFSGKAIESQACLREKKLMEVVMFLSSMEDLVTFEDEKALAMMGEIFKTILEVTSTPNLSDYYPILRGLDLQRLQKRSIISFVKFCSILKPIIKERRERKGGHATSQQDFLDTLISDGFTDDQINILLVV